MTSFTRVDYRNLIKFISKDLNYSVGPLRNFPESGSAVILRHDIDFSVFKALEMAEIELGLGVNSTYFVLLTCPFYNALEQRNTDALKKIARMGNEIGLHYDSSLLEGLSNEQINERIEKQVSILESVTECRIESISQHKPATSKVRPKITRYKDAYDDKYFKQIGYLSDSRKYFATEDVHSFFKKHKRSQLLIHPIWWNSEDHSVQQIFEDLKSQINEANESEFDDFRRNIDEYFSKRLPLSY